MNNLDDMLEQTLDLYTELMNYNDIKQLWKEIDKYFNEVLEAWEVDA